MINEWGPHQTNDLFLSGGFDRVFYFSHGSHCYPNTDPITLNSRNCNDPSEVSPQPSRHFHIPYLGCPEVIKNLLGAVL